MIQILTATEHDIPSVVTCVEALMQELGDPDDRLVANAPEICRAFLTRPGNAVFVAIEDGASSSESRGGKHQSGVNESIRGVMTLERGLTLYTGGLFGTIRELYVRPDVRSSGVGRDLIRRAIDHGRLQGWRRIEVTAPDMPQWLRTKAFYEREGFIDAGPKLKYVMR